jgi:hypothetical protein
MRSTLLQLLFAVDEDASVCPVFGGTGIPACASDLAGRSAAEVRPLDWVRVVILAALWITRRTAQAGMPVPPRTRLISRQPDRVALARGIDR